MTPSISDFHSDAEHLARRTLDAHGDRGHAAIDHHVRWLRGERRGCGSTSDELVGMAEGFREVLRSWGIPDARMSPGEFEAKSALFGVRRWDFAVTRGDGAPAALVEIKFGGARHGHGRMRRDVETFVAMCVDNALADAEGPPIFRGLAMVVPAFRPAGPLRNARVRGDRERRRTELLEAAAACMVGAGLADGVCALRLEGNTLAPLAESLAPERFLARLHAHLRAQTIKNR